MTEYMELSYQYITLSVQVFFGFYYFFGFLCKKIKFYHYILFGGCAVCAVYAVPGGAVAEWGVFFLLLAAAGIWAGHADWRPAVLYAVLVVEMMQLSYGMVNSLISILYPHLYTFDQKTVGFVFMLGGETASLLLAGLSCGLVRRYFSGEISSFHYGTLEKQYMLPVFVPILMIFIMDEYINSFIYGMVVTDAGGTETCPYPNHYQMFVMQLLGMASLFCILFAYKKLLLSFRLSTELSLLEQKERSLNQYVEEAKSHYEKTKSFRHDIKNHITVVKELLQGGKTEEAIHYIGDMENIAGELLFPCGTNNPVVDILMGNKLGIAKSMGIDVCCSLLLPYPCGLRDIDLCIILSNGLDNAIHACRTTDAGAQRYIRISGRIQGDFLMIEIENSYQGKDGFKRGTGLSNIKTVAEKYNGAMSVKTQGNVFVLHVLLIIPQCQESIPRSVQ